MQGRKEGGKGWIEAVAAIMAPVWMACVIVTRDEKPSLYVLTCCVHELDYLVSLGVCFFLLSWVCLSLCHAALCNDSCSSHGSYLVACITVITDGKELIVLDFVLFMNLIIWFLSCLLLSSLFLFFLLCSSLQ